MNEKEERIKKGKGSCSQKALEARKLSISFALPPDSNKYAIKIFYLRGADPE